MSTTDEIDAAIASANKLGLKFTGISLNPETFEMLKKTIPLPDISVPTILRLPIGLTVLSSEEVPVGRVQLIFTPISAHTINMPFYFDDESSRIVMPNPMF